MKVPRIKTSASVDTFITLDSILDMVYDLILRNTFFLEEWVPLFISYQYGEHKRVNYSSHSKGMSAKSLLCYLLASDKDKPYLFKKSGVLRIYKSRIAHFFLSLGETYIQYCNDCLLQKKQPEASVIANYYLALKSKNVDSLYSTVRDVRFWLAKYRELRNTIAVNFLPLIRKEAYVFSNKWKTDLTTDDLESLYFEYTLYAIEKFDIKKGVLAPYVVYWLRACSTEIKRMHKKDMHIYVPDVWSESEEPHSEITVEADIVNKDYISFLRKAARYIDYSGNMRFIHGIEEHLKDDEIRSLRQCKVDKHNKLGAIHNGKI